MHMTQPLRSRAVCEVRDTAVVTQGQWADVLDVSCLAAAEQQRAAAQTANQRACVGCGLGRRACVCHADSWRCGASVA